MQSPREVIKQAFRSDVISHGHVWIDMLEKRNLIAHTYNESRAKAALLLIHNDYAAVITECVNDLKKRSCMG